MVQCPNGHFYDTEKSKTCPYCTNSSQSIGVTMGFDASHIQNSFDIGKTVGMDQPGTNSFDYDIGKTVALDASDFDDDDDVGKTVALFQQEHNAKIDPVVGWLVCIEGKSKGMDYRIHSDNNFIGRSKSMDISISDDETISRTNHAVISFDSKYNKFYFSSGGGRAIVRVNDQSVFSTVELKNYDTIEIGATKLMFIGFCSDSFTWDK